MGLFVKPGISETVCKFPAAVIAFLCKICYTV